MVQTSQTQRMSLRKRKQKINEDFVYDNNHYNVKTLARVSLLLSPDQKCKISEICSPIRIVGSNTKSANIDTSTIPKMYISSPAETNIRPIIPETQESCSVTHPCSYISSPTAIDAIPETQGYESFGVYDDNSLCVFDDNLLCSSYNESNLVMKSVDRHTTTRLSDLSSADSTKDDANSLLLPQHPHGNAALAGDAIPTRVTSRTDPFTLLLKGTNGVILFRGPKDPLSAFFHHPLRIEGKNFISAEQAYQYAKFIHHKLSKTALDELLRCRQSHSVKRIATKWLPRSNNKWDEIKFAQMEQICTAKLRQCNAFRTALQKSFDKLLVHNTETDNVWGCGPDLRGRNMMGHILMNIRNHVLSYDKEFPPLPGKKIVNNDQTVQTANVQQNTSKKSVRVQQNTSKKSVHVQQNSSKKSVLIIGNSNARGISQGLNERGVDGTAYVYPGQTVSQLNARVASIVSSTTQPDAIFIHAGDIEVRESTSVRQLITDYNDLIQTLRHTFSLTHIVINGLTPATNHIPLNQKIESVNNELYRLCQDNGNCVFLPGNKSKLRDRIHLTDQSKDLVARSLASHVKKCL